MPSARRKAQAEKIHAHVLHWLAPPVGTQVAAAIFDQLAVKPLTSEWSSEDLVKTSQVALHPAVETSSQGCC